MDAPRGRKGSLALNTLDRQATASKRRRLVPVAQTGGSQIHPAMAGQMATFKLTGSPKRKAYKPRKRLSVGHGKHTCLCHRLILVLIDYCRFLESNTEGPVPLCVPGTTSNRDIAQSLQARFPSTPSFAHVDDTTTWLVFCSPITMVNPASAPYSNPRVVVELSGTSKRFYLEAHFQRVKSFVLEGNSYTHLSSHFTKIAAKFSVLAYQLHLCSL